MGKTSFLVRCQSKHGTFISIHSSTITYHYCFFLLFVIDLNKGNLLAMDDDSIICIDVKSSSNFTILSMPSIMLCAFLTY